MSVPASVALIALLGCAPVPEDHIVAEGAKRRLRPVLMTVSMTALGLVQLLFASGPGPEIQKP